MSKTYDEFIEVVTAVRTLKLENDITGKRSGIAYIATNIPDLTDWEFILFSCVNWKI